MIDYRKKFFDKTGWPVGETRFSQYLESQLHECDALLQESKKSFQKIMDAPTLNSAYRTASKASSKLTSKEVA